MIIKKIEDELDSATHEFLKTYHSFRDAAVKLMNIMNYIRNDESKGLTSSTGERNIHEFLVQMMDESDRIVQKSFEIKCLTEDEKEIK